MSATVDDQNRAFRVAGRGGGDAPQEQSDDPGAPVRSHYNDVCVAPLRRLKGQDNLAPTVTELSARSADRRPGVL
jgi:hypothetical protein